MSSHVAEFQSSLRAAIAEAKAAGLATSASRLEARAFSAYVTSSELLGETGLAIREFLQSEGSAVPPLTVAKLKRCLKEIQKVWPNI